VYLQNHSQFLSPKGRALCSHTSDQDAIRFFVGTLSTRSYGQIHQLDFDDETNKITKKVYKPKVGEIWHMQCSPTSNNLLGLCYNHITGKLIPVSPVSYFIKEKETGW